MQLIIEGSDALGKTTYCSKLGEVVHHYSKEDVLGHEPIPFWVGQFAAKDGVMDRGHLGGFVYGSMLKLHKWNCSLEDLKSIHATSIEWGWRTHIFYTINELWYIDHLTEVMSRRIEENTLDIILEANRIFSWLSTQLTVVAHQVGPEGFPEWQV